MPKANQRKSALQQANECDVAHDLLANLANLLAGSGITLPDAQAVLARAWTKGRTQKAPRRNSPLKNVTALGEVVSAWTNNPLYLDLDGNPKVLPLRGKNSFATLVSSVDKKLSATDAVSDLKKYGNVRRVPTGRIMLLKRFLHVGNESQLAIEPSIKFLSDATKTMNAIAGGRQSKRQQTAHFWRMADRRDIPRADAPAFFEFMRVRSLAYLQEVDEWLQSRSPPSRKRPKRLRAGIGLFTICGPDAREP